jgi:ubiquinone/menaquinone biosynthesis C-methylase UbiE
MNRWVGTGLRRWFQTEGVEFIKRIGIRQGWQILDFGCGKGYYALPAARVVGTRGLVYALDHDTHALSVLTDQATRMGLFNIRIVHSMDELALFLHDNLLDAALFYDVIHSYYFSAYERSCLLHAMSKIIKDSAVVSVFPRHMNRFEVDGIKRELGEYGFSLVGELSSHLIHDGQYDTGNILNFQKRAKNGSPAQDGSTGREIE